VDFDRTNNYFDDLVGRAAAAQEIPREAWGGARPNCCHENSETFVQRFSGHDVVRGWLVIGGHWFVPHSVENALAMPEYLRDSCENASTD
jgi:hypothetical protein